MIKHRLWFLVILFLLSAALYTAALDYGRPLPEYSPSTVKNAWLNSATIFHPDAFAYVGIAYSMLIKNTLNPDYFHNPSLNIYLNYALFWISGAKTLPHNAAYGLRELAPFSLYVMAQFLSALFSILTVALTYAVGARAINKSVGVFAAMLTALSPMIVQHAHYATPNAMTITMSTAALLLAVIVFKQEKPKPLTYFLAGLFVGLTMSSRYNAAVIGLVTLLAVFSAWRRHHRLSLVLLMIIAVPLGFVMGTPGSIFAFRTFIRHIFEILNWYKIEGGGPGWTTNYGLFYHWRYTVLFGVGPVAGLAAIIGLSVAWKNRREPNSVAWLASALVLYSVVYSLLALPGKRLNANLLLPLIVPLALLAAYGGLSALSLLQRFSPHKKVWINAVGLALLLAWPAYLSAHLTSLLTSPDNRLLAQAWIYEHVQKGTAIGLLGSYNVPLDPLDYLTSTVFSSVTKPDDPIWNSQIIIYSDSIAWAMLRDVSLTENASDITQTIATSQRLRNDWIELTRFPRKYWPGQDTPPDDVSVWHQMGITIYCKPTNCPVPH